MASSGRGLALVLTFGMVAWLAAPIRTGSFGSGWWGTPEALKLRQAARNATVKGDFAAAESIYRRGAAAAALHHDAIARAWCVSGIGDARLAVFDYRGAMAAYLEAKPFAERARDPVSLGAIEANLASLYQQIGDSDSALRAAGEAVQITRQTPGLYYRPQLLQLLARLRADKTSIALYRESIRAARAAVTKNPSQRVVEARSWRLLGEALLKQGDLAGAENAELTALSVAASAAHRDEGLTHWALGELRLKQAEQAPNAQIRKEFLTGAEAFTEQAIAEGAGPAYQLCSQLGLILLAQGRVLQALEELEGAVNQAQRWRLRVVPARTSLDGATAALQQTVFDRFIEAAGDYGIRTGDQRWIEESLEAAELNRAMNLRENARIAGRKLPVEYWEALGRLEAQEGNLRAGTSPSYENLRLKLTELESNSGLGFPSNIAENFPSHGSLIHLQHSLKDAEVFLSFELQAKESFLWAVTRGTLHVYRLAPAGQIAGAVQEFRRAVAVQGSDGVDRKGFEKLGRHLYRMLFGQLDAAETSRPAWLLSVGDILLGLPYGALVPERSGGVRFLAEDHSLEVKAGALLSGKPLPRRAGGFVGVGDPIYNTADQRWVNPRAFWAQVGTSRLTESLGQLNRLPGSRREVESSAAAWGEGPKLMLEDAAATRERFLQALTPAPRVIHLATHTVSQGAGSASADDAYLAFGLGPDGRPELLSAARIRTLHVPGSIVVMTGCSTAPSDASAGLGLAGLVRAWTLAGASAVIATEWAVEDSIGTPLLASFYKHLRAETDTAQALRLAQIEMIHSGTAEAAPGAWAAYQVFGGQFGSRRSDAQ